MSPVARWNEKEETSASQANHPGVSSATGGRSGAFCCQSSYLPCSGDQRSRLFARRGIGCSSCPFPPCYLTCLLFNNINDRLHFFKCWSVLSVLIGLVTLAVR